MGSGETNIGRGRRNSDWPDEDIAYIDMIASRVSDLVDMKNLQLKNEILEGLPLRLDAHFEKHIGSSVHQHAAEHEQLRQLVKTASTIRNVVVSALMASILALGATTVIKAPATSQMQAIAPSQQERYIGKPIKVNKDE